MTVQHTMLNDDSICIVQHTGKLQPPKLYLAVWHAAYPDICDSCGLKAWCDDLFGERGRDCKIHRRGERWVEVKPEQITTIIEISK